jgi:putative ABC transport system permease protein
MLGRASVRHLTRHPGQLALSVVGIALGVAVVLSVDLATESARRSFALFTESVAGRATHQIVGGPAGVPEEVYRRLRVDMGLRESAPVVERDVAAPDFPGVSFHLLGVDPFAEAPFRSFVSGDAIRSVTDVSALLTRPAAALLARDTARALGLAPGDSFLVRVGAVRRRLTLIGELVPGDSLSAQALERLLVTDISTAQELLSAPGRLSRIDLIVPDEPAGAATLSRVRGLLPPGIQVAPAGARAETIAQMMQAFTVNLTALSLLALVVGAFLIYNTMTFSVVQRRELLGMLRALGVTRHEVFGLVMTEALVIGLVATALGVPLGILLGQGLVRLVTRTVNDLYVTLTVRELAIPALALLKAGALGVGGTVLAALAPALEAMVTAPRAVLIRSTIEARARGAAAPLAAGGAVLVLGGMGLVVLTRSGVAVAYAGLFAILLGAAFMTPAATVSLMRVCRPVMGALLGLPGRMAAGAVLQAQSRTSVALAALMVAVAATVSVGIMIGSFRDTVVRWLDVSLRADVYVSVPSLVGSRPDSVLDPALVARLSAAPGVARVNTLRGVRVESPEGAIQMIAVDLDAPGHRTFLYQAGDPATVQRALDTAGAVAVSEPFARRRGLGLGSRLRLHTDRGEREFPVAGVYYDYGSSEGVVMMSRRTYERLWDDAGVTSLGVVAAPGVDLDSLIDSLRRLAGPDQDVVIRSNRALREASLQIFDRTFAVTVVLRYLALIVAFIGVLSALTALALERTRELGVLRAQGFTVRQVWGLVIAQTGLMGLVAGLLAIPVGIGLALILIFVINARSFGWTLQLTVGPDVLVQALLLTLATAVLAGLYPARRMTRLPLPAALRGE